MKDPLDRYTLDHTPIEPMLCQKNEIVTARYFNAMTITQRRLLALAISKLDHTQNAYSRTPEQLTVLVNVAEFAELFDLTRNSVYEEFHSACNALFSTVITTYENRDTGDVDKIHLFEKMHYRQSLGYSEILFTKSGADCFSSYMALSGFTQTRLTQLAKLKSVHAWTLYNLCQQRRDTGIVKIEPDELRHAFGLDQNQYQLSNDFLRYVLKPSIEQINEHTDLNLQMTVNKRGRRIALYLFTFRKYAE